MYNWKKPAAFLMAACLSAQFAAIPAGAVQSEVSGYSDKTKRTVSIDVSKDDPAEEKKNLFDMELILEETKKKTVVKKDYSQEKRKKYVAVPLYYQDDYPDTMYAGGTVATSGCSVTSLAMVATYMTGYAYLPDELAGYFGGRAENNIARLEAGAEALGLPFEKPENWHGALAALKEGKVVIVLTNANSLFTDSQHFIVLTGVTEDGKILVNDSYKTNYEKWNMKKGFEEGFPEIEITKGYEGAWIFDKKAMPQEITRYFEVEPEKPEPRFPDINLTLAQKQLLARVVWAEARGESPEGQQAVAEVVLNRIHSVNFPDNIWDVIFAEGQFRSVPKLPEAQPAQAQYEAIEKAVYGPYILPENVVHFATYQTNEHVWGTIGGHIFCYDEQTAPAGQN